ncbi:hypothetical protein [Actinomadura alba]|uniref:DUF8094 domain-containing protein n=1 Tax=Actinomadura alba TaxID=406431 RepID=A0ABR7LPJ3_9ACTN|nr:hypothetical protein [Actinomadura alba]MBC6466407.1 hypothetical protein [Actinomadura alba]
MRNSTWRVAILLAALTPAAACGIIEDRRPTAARSTPPPPPPTPAVTQAEAKRALALYAARVNNANRRLSPKLAALAATGSTLQLQTSKYKIFKANRLTISPYKYGSALVAAPKFSEHPRWFFAALTDRGGSKPLRDIIVLTQDQPGAPWRAAYTPLTTSPATGPLAAGVDVADFPDVAPQDDASLVLPPARLSGALADVLNRGPRSVDYRSLTLAPWIKTKYRNLREDKTAFQSNGWTGTAAYSSTTMPTYAVRTTSGGALVWSAVELKETFRHTRRGNGITWEHSEWGDLLRPFTGVSTVQKSLNTLERVEVLAYVPPKGKGRIRFLANRWAPISIQGR